MSFAYWLRCLRSAFTWQKHPRLRSKSRKGRKADLRFDCLEDRTVPSAFYDLSTVASTAGGVFSRFGDLASINNHGDVAFVGFTDEGSGLWLDQGNGPLNVNPRFSDSSNQPYRDFDRAVALNDLEVLTARDRVDGSPAAFFVRQWDRIEPDKTTIVASANNLFQNDRGRFSALQTFTDINNARDVAYVGLTADGQYRSVQLLRHDDADGLSDTIDEFHVSSLVAPKPQLTNDGRVLYVSGTDGRLKLRRSLTSSEVITQASTGFTKVGSAPGISGDGRIVVFAGNRGSGDGIFASYQDGQSRSIVRIAGEGDITQDGFTFDLNDAVRVNTTLADERGVTVVFEANHSVVGQGIYAVRLSFFGGERADEFDPDDPDSVSVSGAMPAALVGERLHGNVTISDVELWDGINNVNRGQLAFWAKLSDGAEEILRAEPTPVVWIDFDPTDDPFTGLTKPNLQLLEEVGLTANGWAGSFETTLRAMGLDTDYATFQTQVVDAVQQLFRSVKDGAGSFPTHVRVLGRPGDIAPAYVPYEETVVPLRVPIKRGVYQTVFVGGSPDGERLGNLGMASPLFKVQINGRPDFFPDFFNQVYDDTAVIFADNIFQQTVAWGDPVTSLPSDVRTRAVAVTIAHEAAHNLGLIHLADNLSDQIMHGGTNEDEFNGPQEFSNQHYNTQFVGVQENSGQRLLFAVGGPKGISRAAPNATVLQATGHSLYKLAASLTGNPVNVAGLVLGVVPGGEDHLLPIYQSLGAGDLASRVPAVEVRVHPTDQILLLGSTDGARLDIIGVPNGQTIDLSTVSATALGVSADGRLRVPAGPGVTNPGFQLYHLPATGSPVLMGSVSVQGVPEAGVFAGTGQLSSEGALGMGETTPGGGALSKTLTIRNTGFGPLTLGAITVTGPGYTVTQPDQTTLDPGQQTTITVTLSDTAAGVGITGALTVPSNDPSGPFTLTLRGTVDDRPRVLGVTRLDDGTGSLQVAIDFSAPLLPGPAGDRTNFVIIRGGGDVVPLASAAYSETNGRGRVTLTAAVGGTALASGTYTVRFEGTKVLSAAGAPFATPLDSLLVLGGYGNGTVATIGVGADGTVGVIAGPEPAGFGPPKHIAVADLNGDGVSDVVAVSEYTGELVFHYGLTEGGYEDPITLALARPHPDLRAGPQSVIVADWNGDSLPDLVVFDVVSDYYLGSFNRILVYLNDGRGTFSPAPDTPIPVATEVYGPLLAVGDFTGDGKADVALGGPPVEGSPYNYTAKGSVVIYAKDPFLGYSQAAVISTGHSEWYPDAGVAADFNGDGRLDLVVSNTGYYVYNPRPVVFLSTATGLGPAQDLDYEGEAGALGVGDFTGDGKRDIAIVNDYYSNLADVHDGVVVSLLVGDGQGQFTALPNQVLNRRGVTLAAAGDLNGDGKLDLLLRADPFNQAGFDATPELSLWTLLGNGQGGFTPAAAPVPIGAAGNPSPGNFVLTDLTGDSRPDVLYGNTQTGQIGLATNDGNGKMQVSAPAGPRAPSATEFSHTGIYAESGIVVADLNRDAIPDQLRLVSDAGIFAPQAIDVFLGTADGQFRFVSSIPVKSTDQSPGGQTVGDLGWLRVGDLNNDGWLDLVVSGHGGAVAVYLGVDGVRFTPAATPLVDASASGEVADGTLVDVNGDGNLDLVAMLNEGGFGVFFGDGAGKLTFNANSFLPVTELTPHAPLVADVTGDGKPDLVTGTVESSASKLTVCAGQGNGRFVESFSLTRNPEDWSTSLLSGDFNGDGTLDLLGVVSSDVSYPNLFFYLGNGTGQFTEAPDLQINVDHGIANLVAGDFTGDGKTDLALTKGTNTISDFVSTVTVLPGDGTGRFGPAQLIDVGGKNPWSLAVLPRAGVIEAGAITVDHPPLSAPPGAADLSASTPQGRAALLDPRSLLAGLTPDPLVLAIPNQPNHGSAAVSPNGTPTDLTDDVLLYTPAPGFAGIDQFTYWAVDGRGGSITGMVTVTVNPLPTFSFSVAAYAAGPDGGSATITVTRSGDLQATASVSYATADGTAVAGLDYVSATGVLTFQPGQTSRTFSVSLLDNPSGAEGRTVLLSLQRLGDTVLGSPAAAVLTLAAPDYLSTFAYSAATYPAGPGAGQTAITITRIGDLGQPASITYATADDTALAGIDYVSTTGTLTFQAGEVSKTFSVSVLSNPFLDAYRIVQLSLMPGTNAALGAQASAEVIIAAPRSNVFAVPEDTRSPAGNTVRRLLGSFFRDGDAGALDGMALIGVSSAGQGVWQYSVNGGLTWLKLGAVNPSKARLLRGQDQLRFLPAAHFQGQAAIQFRAWDRTFGAAGRTANLTAPGAVGGATAFSTATGWVVALVTPVNDRPILDPGGESWLHSVTPNDFDPQGNTVADLLDASVTDVDARAVHGLALIGKSGGGGVWQYRRQSGSVWINVAAVSTNSALLLAAEDQVRFVPNPGFTGVVRITYRAWDQTSGRSGGRVAILPSNRAFSVASETASLVVTATPAPVNHAPVLDTAPNLALPAGTEDNRNPAGTSVARLLDQGFSDSDPNVVRGVAVTGLTGNGTWQFSLNLGQTWATMGSVSPSRSLLFRDTDLLRFVPAANFHGQATIRYRAWDRTHGSAGARADLSLPAVTGGASPFSIAEETAMLTIDPVNDRPVLNTIPTPRLTPLLPNATDPAGDSVAALLGTAFSDVDSGSLQGIVVVGATTGGTWSYSLQGGNWTPLGQVSATAGRLLRPEDSIRFVPNTGFTGVAQLSYRAWDQTLGGAGDLVALSPATTAFSLATESATITVNGVNDRPVLDIRPNPFLSPTLPAPATPTGTTVASLLAGAVTDIDPGAQFGIALVGTTAIGGKWQYSLDGTNWIDLPAVTSRTALLLRASDSLRFVPTGLSATAQLRYRAWDQTLGNAGTTADVKASGATAFSVDSELASLVVNTAPELRG